MGARYIDLDRGRREARIGKGAERDGDQIGRGRHRVVDGRAAARTEPEGERVAAVGGAHIVEGLAFDALDLRLGEAGLGAEYAAGPLLAGEAMADGDPDRLARCGDAELS